MADEIELKSTWKTKVFVLSPMIIASEIMRRSYNEPEELGKKVTLLVAVLTSSTSSGLYALTIN